MCWVLVGSPWALVGRALVARLGNCGLGPLWTLWAFLGWALMVPPWVLVGQALVDPPGPLWVGPFGAPLGPCEPGVGSNGPSQDNVRLFCFCCFCLRALLGYIYIYIYT